MASLQRLVQKQRYDKIERRALQKRIARCTPFFGEGTPAWMHRASEWISPQMASAAAYFNAKHGIEEGSA